MRSKPDAGTAWFGRTVDLLRLSEPEIAEAGIGRKFQKPTVFEFLTVFENLELALAGKKSFWTTLVARLSGDQRAAQIPYPAEVSTSAGVGNDLHHGSERSARDVRQGEATMPRTSRTRIRPRTGRSIRRLRHTRPREVWTFASANGA